MWMLPSLMSCLKARDPCPAQNQSRIVKLRQNVSKLILCINKLQTGHFSCTKNHKDLINKLLLIKDNPREIKKRSIKSKKSYFNFFQNNIVADFIIHKTFNTAKKFNHVWSK